MRALALLALALAAATAAGAEPKVVMEVKGGMRPGPDSPFFALYNDGLVIFRAPQSAPAPSGYRAARLSRGGYQTLVAAIEPDAFLKLGASYDAVTATDPVANVIHVWIGGRRRTVSVDGHLSHASARARTPPEFLRAYDAIMAFSAPAAPVWVPASIEILLSPQEGSREQAVPWPPGWPSPEGAAADRDGIRRVSLPQAQFEQIRKLLGEWPGATVQSGRRRWRAEYRLPFPHESMWSPPAAAAQAESPPKSGKR